MGLIQVFLCVGLNLVLCRLERGFFNFFLVRMSVMQVHMVLLRGLLGHISNFIVWVLITLSCLVVVNVYDLLVIPDLFSSLVKLCRVKFLRFEEADWLIIAYCRSFS